MTAPTQPVTIRLADFGGPARAGVKITLRPSGIDYTADGTFVSDAPVVVITDANGEATANIFPNALAPSGLGTMGTTIRVTAPLKGGRGLDVLAAIPNAPCNLVDYLVDQEPQGLSASQKAASDAQAARDVAVASRQQADADALQTGQDRTAVAADRVQTGQDRAQTGADRVQTGQDRAAADAASATAQAARDAAIQGQNVGVVGFPDKATMDASLAFADKTIALVTNDPTSTNNVFYRKTGASGAGAWVQATPGDLALLAARVGGVTEMFTNPNFYSDFNYAKLVAASTGGTTDSSGTYVRGATTVLAQITGPAGRPGFSFTTSANGAAPVFWNVPIATLGAAPGDKVSACFRALAASVVAGAAGTTRVLLRQITAAGAEIVASRQTFTFAVGAVASDQVIQFPGVTLDATCATVGFYIDTANTGTLLKFSDVMLAKGSVADYRPAPAAYVDGRADARIAAAVASAGYVSGTDVTRALAPLFLRPNLLSNDWTTTVALGNAGPLRSVTSFENRPAVLCDNTNGEWFIDFPRSNFPSGFASAGARLCARTLATGGRILIFQVNAGNAEIAGTRVTLTAANGAALPAALAGTATLDPACVTVRLFISAIGGANGNTVTWQDVFLADGQEQVFRPYVPATASAKTEAFVGPAGNDNTGAGTAAAPYATIDKAITAVGGNGVVWVLDGAYGPQSVTPSNIKGRVDIRGVRSALGTGTYDFPVIRLATKLAGITKTAGQVKVYQAAVAGLPALASYQWAYQDGVADPRTLIADADREPQHRGRTNRLQNFAKLPKTTATVLAAALAEMDASALPLSFIDNGILYFTIVGGGDGTAANIYLDAANGLIGNATQGSAGVLNIYGLEARYGGINLRPFKSSHLDEVVAAGSRINAVDYNVLTFGTLEVSCSGSQDQFNGDGLNGHNGARLEWGMDLYSHDCWDDGFSDHEGCTSRIHGGLIEYNGGSAVIPALGSDNVTRNVVSRRNQQRAGWKASAFHALGPPSEGYDTRALFVNCIDIESTQSFGDDMSGASARAMAINCKSIRPATRGFNCYLIRDCGYIASGGSTARNAATLVENTSVVA